VQFFRVEDDVDHQQDNLTRGGSASSLACPLHCTLSDWADAMLVIPLDASSLADVSSGHPGNPGPSGCLLPRVLRCWDPSKDVLVVPGLNRYEKRNPATARQLSLLGSPDLFSYVRILRLDEHEGGDVSSAPPPSPSAKEAQRAAHALLAASRRYRAECGDGPTDGRSDDTLLDGCDGDGDDEAGHQHDDGIRRRKW